MLPTSTAVLYLATGLGAVGSVRCSSWIRVSGLDMRSSFAGCEAGAMQKSECRSRMQKSECRMQNEKTSFFNSAFCILTSALQKNTGLDGNERSDYRTRPCPVQQSNKPGGSGGG